MYAFGRLYFIRILLYNYLDTLIFKVILGKISYFLNRYLIFGAATKKQYKMPPTPPRGGRK